MSIRDRAAEVLESPDRAASADVPDFAAALLRLTGEEMRDAIARIFAKDSRGCPDDGCPACREVANAVMVILLAAAEGKS